MSCANGRKYFTVLFAIQTFENISSCKIHYDHLRPGSRKIFKESDQSRTLLFNVKLLLKLVEPKQVAVLTKQVGNVPHIRFLS